MTRDKLPAPVGTAGPRLQVGDIATWTSQAAGSETIKTGEVVRVNLKGETVPITTADDGPRHFQSWSLVGDRYIVRIPPKTKRGKPHYYGPLCSVVDRQMGTATLQMPSGEPVQTCWAYRESVGEVHPNA